MSADTWTGYGIPFIEVQPGGYKIHHGGDGDTGWGHSDFLPVQEQADEDKVKRLNELGFTIVTEMLHGNVAFYITDETLELDMVTKVFPYKTPKENLAALHEWFEGINPDALNEERAIIWSNGDE